MRESADKLAARTRAFARAHMRPFALAADAAKAPPPQFLAAAVAAGVGLGTADPGRDPGFTYRDAVIAAEELAWGDAALTLCLPGPGLGGSPLAVMGTAEQRRRLMGMLAGPEPRWGAYAVTEPEAGSDVAAIQTTCRPVADGFELTGTKCFITNGGRASWVLVHATVDRALGPSGHRILAVERGTPGFEVVRVHEKLGLAASETVDLRFDGCRVPRENLLGGDAAYQERSGGFKAAMRTFDLTRPVVAAMAVGIGRAALEAAAEHLGEGGAEGDRLRLREVTRRLEAARVLVRRAAYLADTLSPSGAAAAAAKVSAARAAQEACVLALEVVGLSDPERSPLVAKWLRDVRVFDIFEGTGQIQRLIIARSLLAGAGP